MQKVVEIDSENLRLRGMLHIPENINNKVPIVIIFHGFCGDKMGPHFIFVKLSRLLEKAGIACIRFDFAGSGESDGDFIDMTMDTELKDANNILNYVRTLNFVDNDKIGIVGLSMGGAIASMLAGERKSDIETLCLWAPAGNMGEIILDKHYIGANFEEFRQNGYFDVEGLLVGTKFMDNVKNIKIYEKASEYDKKSLIIHGDKDDVVSLSASQKYIDFWGDSSLLKVISGANHTFDKREWEEQVIDNTIEFIEKQL
ncbi:alpha/beta hydrolase [Clostridium estertheticum]|uniref:alpha/beta hydrolase n=1 Tax=Clostridium estertheticum TaxID=238834 RepID=UPI001C0C8A29|nr:alpha/beta hydrolase [Clostridium estertheticum]MBU3075156.1 alpha/beta hydrolase [Clostridium estertheticum]MBU3165371.1 alpha/beta hydrolase [Clostridium estertheticum]MBU3173128.1 alpha/beta hydrolase [Clostridium estertheticum]